MNKAAFVQGYLDKTAEEGPAGGKLMAAKPTATELLRFRNKGKRITRGSRGDKPAPAGEKGPSTFSKIKAADLMAKNSDYFQNHPGEIAARKRKEREAASSPAIATKK